jgi:hypothetical protein
MIGSTPASINSTAGVVTFIGGRSLHGLKPARAASTAPTTERVRSKPVPGQPPANVEYRRRKMRLSGHLLHCDVVRANRTPKRAGIFTL